MTNPVNDQITRAEDIADEMNLNGHDDVVGSDVLDALASVGYMLAPDDAGVSTLAYQRSVSQ